MQKTNKLNDFFQNNLPHYLELHRQMVSINSFTENAAGVNELGLLTAKIFAALNFEAEFVQANNPKFGRHLSLKRNAHQANRAENPPTIAMISHLDTVFPPEEEIANDFVWRQEGDRLYGPGTVDIKGGTVMIYMVLDALQNFYPEVLNNTNWLVLLDASEERLSVDFGEFCLQRLPQNTLACLVFEGGTHPNGDFYLVVARKGRATFRVHVEGRSAHAGNNHAQGANAILQMAYTVQKIAGFTDYDKEITFNVGVIHGGSVVNRVPHTADAEIEMRAFSPQVFAEGVDKMLSLNGVSQVSSADGYPCSVSIRMEEQTAPWPRNDATEKLYQLWEKTGNQRGFQVRREERGGLSDGNWLWNHFPTFDGLGPSGANGHCSERTPDGSKDQEYAQISSFIPKALLNTMAIVNLVQNNP